jgi:hypothetical protein
MLLSLFSFHYSSNNKKKQLQSESNIATPGPRVCGKPPYNMPKDNISPCQLAPNLPVRNCRRNR